VFHHDTHTHPAMAPTSGIASGSWAIPNQGESSANVWYELQLTAKDSVGLTTTVTRDINPVTVPLTVTTNQAGLTVLLDGQPSAAPKNTSGVVGIIRSIGVDSPQYANNKFWAFSSWSDGGAQTHNIVAPATDTTYTANYVKQTSGTFGTTTIGSSIDTASINLKEVSKYTAVASNVTKLTGYISGLGAASGSQKIKAVIYADNGSGHPGALLGVSNEVTVTAGQAFNWVDFPFASPVAVQAGTIWMGYIASSTSDLTQLRYDNSPGELNFNVNSGGYAAGPTNPFGTPTLSNKHYSLYATYTTGALAVAHMNASRG
jgi:hypothetical protein